MAKTPRFSGKMRPMRHLRMSYGCLTNVLRFFTDYSNVKIQNKKRDTNAPNFEKMRLMRILRIFYGYSMILY